MSDADTKRRRFQAGDVVIHIPSVEMWLLACDETDDGKVVACGWPETMAYAADCTLHRGTTPDERLKILEQVSSSRIDTRSGYSYRKSLAASQLQAAKLRKETD